jgi:hypothetical protein
MGCRIPSGIQRDAPPLHAFMQGYPAVLISSSALAISPARTTVPAAALNRRRPSFRAQKGLSGYHEIQQTVLRGSLRKGRKSGDASTSAVLTSPMPDFAESCKPSC